MNREQLQAILWLRWRLTKNRLGRAGPVNAALSFVLLALLAIGGVSAGVGGLLAGAFGLARLKPEILLLVWDGVLLAFLVLWVSGLLAEIQRSESIDLPKLLHLPVTLQQVFLFNYVVSHFTPSIILFVPGMVGLGVGLTLGAGLGMALLIPLVLGFVFMLSAWTYCLRGWLAALMINKRRRRAVVLWATIVLILVVQIPNILVHSRLFPKKGQRGETGSKSQGLVLPAHFVQGHLAVPPGWVGFGAMSLKRHEPWPALGATVACALLGCLGLKRAYRMTIRFYQGAEDGAPRRPAPKAITRTPGPLLVECRLPWLPDDTAGLALATFRSLLRTPELKMALIMPVVLLVALGSVHFTRPNHALSPHLTAFAATVAAVVSVFCLAPAMANAFGLDRNGFRALVLLPTRRHHILFAKNLAFFPFVGVAALFFLGLLRFILGISWQAFLASWLQVCMAFLLFSLTANLLAILTPYRMAAGTLQAKKPKAIVFVAAFVNMLTLPVVLTPGLIPPGLQFLFSWKQWMPWLPVNLLASVVMLAGAAWLYWLVLPFEGRLLQSREQAILREVTEEVE